MGQSLVRKLLLKPGYKVLVINQPEEYDKLLGELPEEAELTNKMRRKEFDLVQLFVKSRSELESTGPEAISCLKEGGILWLCYPKKTSKINSDINRDSGWDVVTKLGWEIVSSISIDDTWTGLRFKPKKEA